MNQNSVVGGAGTSVDPALVTYTHIIYALHTVTVITAVLTSATVVGSFIFGLPSIIAVIMNYVRRPAVAGTYLESHFRWQIRTFWFALLISVILGFLSVLLLPLLGLGIVVWMFSALVIGAWVIYRVARGWIALRDRRPMYV
jgi:uncharacterized membrane protein